MKYNRGDYYARFLSSESCNSFYLNVLLLKRLEIEESNDEGSQTDIISLTLSLFRKALGERSTRAGWARLGVYVRACVIGSGKMRVAITMHRRVVLTSISRSGPSDVTSLSFHPHLSWVLLRLLFLLRVHCSSFRPPLSWIYSLQGCLLQSNLILIPAAHPPIQQIER